VHPSDEILLTFATGRADLPLRALLEGHLEDCASCRAALAEINAAGGALLADLPEEPLPASLWERVRASVQGLPQGPAAPDSLLAGLPLPASVRRELPPTRELRWHSLPARGARIAVLARDPHTGSVLLLGHMPARRSFPLHTHVGPEDVLVLAGGYADQFGTFEAGAYASYIPGSEHRPFTEPDEECWTLTRLEQPNVFRGWRGWVQRLLR
jgi:putative transcriptional regulator